MGELAVASDEERHRRTALGAVGTLGDDRAREHAGVDRPVRRCLGRRSSRRTAWPDTGRARRAPARAQTREDTRGNSPRRAGRRSTGRRGRSDRRPAGVECACGRARARARRYGHGRSPFARCPDIAAGIFVALERREVLPQPDRYSRGRPASLTGCSSLSSTPPTRGIANALRVRSDTSARRSTRPQGTGWTTGSRDPMRAAIGVRPSRRHGVTERLA